MPDEIANKRIPLKPATFERLRDFTHGLGASYDDTVEFLLNLVRERGEDDLMAGRRLRGKYNEDRAEDEEPSIVAVPAGLPTTSPRPPAASTRIGWQGRPVPKPGQSQPEPVLEDVDE